MSVVPDPWAWPEPEVRARAAEPGELNSTARALVRLSGAGGWDVRATYARGTAPEASNRWVPGHVVDSVMVRARRGGVTVVALWEDGKARGAWFKADGMAPYRITMRVASEVLGS